MKKILITGSEGFIGSHLCELLCREGYNIRAMCLYNSFGYKGWLDSIDSNSLENIEIINGDIRDRSALLEAMRGCDAVINLAALIAIPYSYSAPESYVDTNIKGTLNLLENARILGTEKIIHTSTSEVYGTAQYVPINEEHPLNAQSPYAATKIAADQLALSYHKSFDLPVAIARPFNTYGPRQSNRAVIPTIISQISKGERSLRLGSLTPTRDFNFVEDTARGILKILESPKSIGEVINLGSGFEISIGDTVKLISEVMNVDVDIIQENQRIRPEKSEVERLFCDPSKAQKLLNWQANFAGTEGFKNGLKKRYIN